MDAAGHAQRASALLSGVEARLRAVDEMDEMQRLEMVASGAIKQHNSEVDTSLTLARNHALTSLAMQGLDPALFEPSSDPGVAEIK